MFCSIFGFALYSMLHYDSCKTNPEIGLMYIRVVQLLHSCGPLFKIIRVFGPQSAKNSYFRSKIRVFSKKKKSLHLESVYKIPILAQNHSVLQKKLRLLLLIDKTCAKLICGMRPASP